MDVTLILRAPLLVGLMLGAAGAAELKLESSLICPQVFQPVCGTKGGDRRDFANTCLAEDAGFTVASSGKCDGAQVLPRFCPKEHAPVCGERDGKRQRFGNACEARAANFAIIHEGAC